MAHNTYEGEWGYLDMMSNILNHGKEREDRTGTGTYSIFSSSLVYDLQEGFPAVTTKQLFWKGVAGELLWFLSGSNDLPSLRRFTYGEDKGQRTIWTDDFTKYSNDETGGRIYGVQWRSAAGKNVRGVDQVQNLIDTINSDTTSRRLMINSWNAAEVHKGMMALPPCHFCVQFYIEDGYLHCKWSQRSCDVFLGVAYNIASYALLTHLIAHWTGYKPGILIGDLTNVHLYKNHVDQAIEQVNRKPFDPPTLKIPSEITLGSIKNYTASDFQLINYQHHEKITAPQSS